MLAVTDVHYFNSVAAGGEATHARAACLLVDDWAAATARAQHVVEVSPIAAYEPGAFYKRELPCVLAVLRQAPPLRWVVVDGYVWLDEARRPGLGAYVYEALGRTVPVVGIAKTAFAGSAMALPLRRPSSRRPLFVTAVGMPGDEALRLAERLHGPHRIPTLLAEVDRLARQG